MPLEETLSTFLAPQAVRQHPGILVLLRTAVQHPSPSLLPPFLLDQCPESHRIRRNCFLLPEIVSEVSWPLFGKVLKWLGRSIRVCEVILTSGGR